MNAYERVRQRIETGHGDDIRVADAASLTDERFRELACRFSAEDAETYWRTVQPWLWPYSAVGFAWNVELDIQVRQWRFLVYPRLHLYDKFDERHMQLRFGLGHLASEQLRCIYEDCCLIAFYAWRLSDEARQLRSTWRKWDEANERVMARMVLFFENNMSTSRLVTNAHQLWREMTPAGRRRWGDYLDTHPAHTKQLRRAMSPFHDRMRYEVSRVECTLTRRFGRDVANLIGEFVTATIRTPQHTQRRAATDAFLRKRKQRHEDEIDEDVFHIKKKQKP